MEPLSGDQVFGRLQANSEFARVDCLASPEIPPRRLLSPSLMHDAASTSSSTRPTTRRIRRIEEMRHYRPNSSSFSVVQPQMREEEERRQRTPPHQLYSQPQDQGHPYLPPPRHHYRETEAIQQQDRRFSRESRQRALRDHHYYQENYYSYHHYEDTLAVRRHHQEQMQHPRHASSFHGDHLPHDHRMLAPSQARPRPFFEEPEEPQPQHEETVEWVHHASPMGPAVSVFPRGIDWRQSSLENFREEQHQHASQPTRPALGGFEDSLHVPPAPRGGQQRHYYVAESGETRSQHSSGSSKPGSYHEPGPPPRKTEVEISPGVMETLRGAAETKECVRRDFFIPTKCFACELEMFCIQNAAYVLCPSCRVVNPLDDSADAASKDGSTSEKEGATFGLGLGFTMDELASMQQEAMKQSS